MRNLPKKFDTDAYGPTSGQYDTNNGLINILAFFINLTVLVSFSIPKSAISCEKKRKATNINLAGAYNSDITDLLFHSNNKDGMKLHKQHSHFLTLYYSK